MKRSLSTPPPLSSPKAVIGGTNESLQSIPQAPKKPTPPSPTCNDYFFMLPFPLECMLPECNDDDYLRTDPAAIRRKPLLLPRRSRYTEDPVLPSCSFCPLEWPEETGTPVTVLVRPMAVRPNKDHL